MREQTLVGQRDKTWAFSREQQWVGERESALDSLLDDAIVLDEA